MFFLSRKACLHSITLFFLLSAVLLMGCVNSSLLIEEKTLEKGWKPFTDQIIGFYIERPENLLPQYATQDTIHIANFDIVQPRYSEGNTDDLHLIIQAELMLPNYTLGHLYERLASQSLPSVPQNVQLGEFIKLAYLNPRGSAGPEMTYYAFDDATDLLYSIHVSELQYSRNKALVEKMVKTFRIVARGNVNDNGS